MKILKKLITQRNRTDYKGVVTNITINNYMRNIKVFFNYMFSEKLIRTNPAEGLKRLKASRKPKYYIKDEEVIRLLNNFDETLFHEYRDGQITGVLLYTGMRLGETLLIEDTHIDFTKRCIFYQRKTQKGKRIDMFSFLLKQV